MGLEDYGHAIAALALWALIVVALIPISVQTRNPETLTDIGKPKRDYADRGYRADRALTNAGEASGPFIAATAAAILAGASPFWVNLLASMFILARIAMAYVHIATTNQKLRSAFWAIGMLCVLLLAFFALGAVFI